MNLGLAILLLLAGATATVLLIFIQPIKVPFSIRRFCFTPSQPTGSEPRTANDSRASQGPPSTHSGYTRVKGEALHPWVLKEDKVSSHPSPNSGGPPGPTVPLAPKEEMVNCEMPSWEKQPQGASLMGLHPKS